MYIIGKSTDSLYSIDLKIPATIAGASELNETPFKVTLTAPLSDEEKPIRYVHLYASNSNSNPYISKNNYWENLIPFWRFVDKNGDVVYDLPVELTERNENNGTEKGSAEFYFVDDMPNDIKSPIYIWATLNTQEDTTLDKEIVITDVGKYEPPSYSNSKLIAVGKVDVNPIIPTSLYASRNTVDLLSAEPLWEGHVIPFLAIASSDHFSEFRTEEELENFKTYSDIVFKYPKNIGEEIQLSGDVSILSADEWISSGDISGYFENPPYFRLVDDRNGYNYKTGGYTVCKMILPEISGEDLTCKISLSSNEGSEGSADFKYFDCWTSCTTNNKIFRTNVRDDDGTDAEIEEYIRKNIVTQGEDKKVDIEVTKGDESTLEIGGISCGGIFAVDPIGHAWSCDTDTGFLYKINAEGKFIVKINLTDKLDEWFSNNSNVEQKIRNEWEHVKQFGVSPNSIVLDGKNTVYITLFDSILFVEINGKTAEINNVAIFSDFKLDDKGLALESSWKPVCVDTNEDNEAAVLFQTNYNDSEEKEYDLDNDTILAKYINGTFTQIKVPEDFISVFDDTNQILFRTRDGMDYFFICGTSTTDGYSKTSLKKLVGMQKENEYAIIEATTLFTKEEKDHFKNGDIEISNLFIDNEDTMWFALNRENHNSEFYTYKNIFDQTDNPEIEKVSITPNFLIAGISKIADGSVVLVDGTNKVIRKYRDGALLPKTYPIEGSSDLMALYDFTGSMFITKYLKPNNDIITTDDELSKFNVYNYANYYIRKHNEDWSSEDHTKIPVIHTNFPEENPNLFKAIGESLGTAEHGNYGLGRKIFEGIANQVNNIHDIEECHIDNIYTIADKEDVQMDSFILTYPEEMKRIANLMSIDKKKLWGDRCHCTENYFKVSKEDPEITIRKALKELKPLEDIPEEDRTDDIIAHINDIRSVIDKAKLDIESKPRRFCKACGHDHGSNLGDEIDMYKFRLIDEEDKPVTYIVENKFHRNHYQKIHTSHKSYNEAVDILDRMERGEYFDAEDLECLRLGKQNRHIILYASVMKLGEIEKSCDLTDEDIRNAKIFAIHTSFFTEDHWFNYCMWEFVDLPCKFLNTSVINWDSDYTSLPEYNSDKTDKSKQFFDWEDENGTMEKFFNYVLHNGCIFHKSNDYIDD